MPARAMKPRSPKNIITIVCEAWPEPHPNMRHDDATGFTCGAWSLHHSRRSERRVWRHATEDGSEIDALWLAIERCLPERGSTWILVPDVSEWFMLSEAYYKLVTQHLWIPGVNGPRGISDDDGQTRPHGKPGYLALGGSSEVFSGRYCGWSVEIVGVGNYHPGSVCELLQSVADEETAASSMHTDRGRYVGHGHRAAGALHRWFVERVIAWSEAGTANWRHTASQLSHSAGRRVYGDVVITPTDRPEVRTLERDACYGGRAEVFDVRLFGHRHASLLNLPRVIEAGVKRTVGTPLFRYDIRSCYPYILGNFSAPRRLKTVQNGQCDPASVLQDDAAIQLAYCRVKTEEPWYPCRVDIGREPLHSGSYAWPLPLNHFVRYRTIFPVGEFWATLCGAELKAAAQCGHIVELHNLCTYEITNSIKPYMAVLWNRRNACAAAGDFVGESMWKMLANSYLGKFAATSGRWEMAEEIGAYEPFAQWVEADLDAKTWTKYRSIGWIVQRQKPREDNPRSHPIMWAWATSQARDMLLTYMRLAGFENVVQCDTDGFYVTRDGKERLERCNVLPQLPGWGDLRFVSEHSTARFWGPKHYYTNVEEWVLSGVPDGFTLRDGAPNFAYQSQYTPACDSTCEGLVGRVKRFTVVPQLCTGRMLSEGSTGRTEPIRVQPPPSGAVLV